MHYIKSDKWTKYHIRKEKLSLERKPMEDFRLPAPLVGMLKHTKLTGMPVVQTDLQATKLSVTIIWDLATSAPKKSKKQPAKKKPSKPSAPSTTTKPPTSKPAKKTPTLTRQPTPPKQPQRPTPATPSQPTPTSSLRRPPPATTPRRQRTRSTLQQQTPAKSPPPMKTSPMQTDPPVNEQLSKILYSTEGKPFYHFIHKGYTIRAGFEDHNDISIFELIHPTDVDPHYIVYQAFEETEEITLELYKNPDSKFYVHDWYDHFKKRVTMARKITDDKIIGAYVDMLNSNLIECVQPARDATT